MAGEPFAPEEAKRPAAPAPAIAPPAPNPRPRIECRDGCVIALEEPIDLIRRGFFQLRGWLASERPLPALNAIVNGERLALHVYPRPDVQSAYPGTVSVGFSTFVRLGDVPKPERMTIQILAGADHLLEHAAQSSPEAVAVGRLDAEARREKREWLIGRMRCVACGGDLAGDATCRSCATRYEEPAVLNCIPPAARGSMEIEFNGAVCSHGYDGDVERVIAQAERSGGKVLDCGAGLRPSSRRNVVTTDIFPYPTTDVLAVNQRLPFKDGTFDAVLSLHVLEHVADPFACAGELCRVLKPGGTLFAVTPMIVPEHGYPHHFFNPTREGLARLFGRTNDTARVFVPAMGHPINGVWSTLALYRDSLPAAERERFMSLSVRDVLARPIEEWITTDVAVALSDEGRMRLAGNFCIEFVK